MSASAVTRRPMKVEAPNKEPAEAWQNLPFELVLVVLEHLVHQNPERAYQIVLVSRAVQRCIDPFLYEVVTLWTNKAIILFSDTVCKPECVNKPPSFFRDHVKSICYMVMEDELDWACPQLILSRCPQIHTLAFRHHHRDLFYERNLPLRKLSTEWTPWLRILDAKPLFPSLTHLELVSDYHHWDELRIPECLPLTHLFITPKEDSLSFLSRSTFPPTLKVIIIRMTSIDTACLEGNCQHDIRIVYCFNELPLGVENLDHFIVRRDDDLNFSLDWGRTPVGELNIWEMAEDVVAKRREMLRLKEEIEQT